jgi:ABC-type uncharacterized transport system YnjBCD ATPase subunit
MKNVDMTVANDVLTIKVDLTKRFGPSSTGKSTIVASTGGAVVVPDHEHIKLGLNLFTK